MPVASLGSVCVWCRCWGALPWQVMSSSWQGPSCHRCPSIGHCGGEALQDTDRWCALVLVCREAPALPPAAHARLSAWKVAFPKGISHPGMNRIPGKQGHVTQLCRAGCERWTSHLQTHLRCHSRKHFMSLAKQVVGGGEGRHLTWTDQETHCNHEGSHLNCFSPSGSIYGLCWQWCPESLRFVLGLNVTMYVLYWLP